MINSVNKTRGRWIGGMAAEVAYTVVCMLIGLALCALVYMAVR